MSRKYTAQEMREMAIEAEVIEVADQFYGHAMDTIAAMLRQAADMADSKKKRKRKYEYSEKKKDGEIDIQHQESLKEARSLKFFKDSTIVRRSVGEWEDV